MSRLLVLALVLGLAAPLAAQPMNPDATPVGGTLRAAGGTAEATVSLRAVSPVPAEGCVGYVDPSAPDVVVDWAGGDLAVSVRGDFDATLAVHRPDGSWACDDDSVGVLPEVELSDAPAGRYAVWVGAFSQETSGTEATVVAGTPPPRPTLGPASAALAGRIDAVGGFEADQGAIEVTVSAGGPDAASRLDVGGDVFCGGYLDAARASAAVDYDADGGTGALVVGGVSFEDDLVLVVRGPDGAIDCNDDFGGTDPVVVVQDAESGTYTVWLGTFGVSDPVTATLTLTETAPEMDFGPDIGPDFGGGTPYAEGTYLPLDLTGNPAVRLSADDAGGNDATVSVRPEGENPVSGPLCMGYVETTPTAALTLAGDGPFAVTASADDDLTLTLRTPGGDWFCSDDADGLDPGIQIDEVEAGRYLVWVGTFGDLDALVEATVAVGPGVVESTSDDGPVGMSQSDGTHDGSVLTPGPGRVAVAVGSDAPVEAGGPLENPVVGDACAGFLHATPTATTTVDGPVTIFASADDTDLTLVVRTPDGAWTCSDDADGPDPAATVDGGAGTVTIWVGTFSRRTTPVAATLAVEDAD